MRLMDIADSLHIQVSPLSTELEFVQLTPKRFLNDLLFFSNILGMQESSGKTLLRSLFIISLSNILSILERYLSKNFSKKVKYRTILELFDDFMMLLIL
jgi:uncharacterized protein VirK/YbjX